MFSLKGTFPAVGVFSLTHAIVILVCLVFIGVAVYLTKNMTKQTYFKLLKIFAIVLTAMELFKICWSLGNGLFDVNAWVPLYFCSLFLYSLWLSCSRNDFIKNLGLSYIAMAGVIAGLIFIVFPTTSFNSYPIFHFQCIYSMLYHSVMVYSGIMLFLCNVLEINKKAVINYCVYCAIFMTLAIIVNLNFENGNMMFLDNPAKIPLPFLHTIYKFSKILYTFVIIISHMSLCLVILATDKIIKNHANKVAKAEKIIENQEESDETIGDVICGTLDLDEDFEEKLS